ncbi:MAG: type II toxin-antitoxin system PemK/MazF family toxin [Actinobacteria bacterium]|nr:type II toxin-antitoxin system PemK/MazF family toxin [Actinomycetota bacterium]
MTRVPEDAASTGQVIRRGEIWTVDWTPGRGSEQTGLRPALVIQTDAACRNQKYPNVIVLAVSTSGRNVPFHIPLTPTQENGLRAPSFVKCEQILTISKDRLRERWGTATADDMDAIAEAVRLVLAIRGARRA